MGACLVFFHETTRAPLEQVGGLINSTIIGCLYSSVGFLKLKERSSHLTKIQAPVTHVFCV